MKFRYPLPEVPINRWNAKVTNSQCVALVVIEADSIDSAELRALAVIDYDYEDDLTNATAEVMEVIGENSKYFVRVTIPNDED